MFTFVGIDATGDIVGPRTSVPAKPGRRPDPSRDEKQDGISLLHSILLYHM